jgi:hypothetical protein
MFEFAVSYVGNLVFDESGRHNRASIYEELNSLAEGLNFGRRPESELKAVVDEAMNRLLIVPQGKFFYRPIWA